MSKSNTSNTKNKQPSTKSIKVQKSIMDRLNRIEGQVRGIKNMIDQGTYCGDIINQMEAARSALASVELILLESHFKHCLKNQIENGDSEATEEVLKIIKKLMK